MLSPRWRKVVRDVWLHKPRTALVVLAIVVGIVGAGSVLNTWSLLRRVTREGYLATNPPSATLRMDAIDPDFLARVRGLPSVQDVQARRTVVASVVARGTARTAMLFAANDLATSALGKVTKVSGAWPPADGAFVVEHSSVEFGELAVGDTVSVRVGEGATRSLPVTGIARDAGLAPGWMEHIVYGFVTPATLAQLGAPASPNELRIVVRDARLDRDAIRRVAVDIKSMAEAAGHKVTDVEVPVPGRHIHAGQMDSLLYTQGAFGLLSLLLSAFLVVNLVAAMLAGQVREIGVMKAVGAGPGQIARMYLGLAFVLGVIATAIALPVAAFIGRQYAEFSAAMLNFDLAGYTVPWASYAAQIVVGALLPVAAAAVPVMRGCRIPVNEALRDFGIGDAGGGGGGGRLLSGWSGVARPLLFSLRNAFRRRQRMVLTLLTLSMGGAVFLGALNLRASIRRSVGELYGSFVRFDIVLRLTVPHRADSLTAAASSVGGVERAEAWGGARAAIDRGDGLLAGSFPVTALPPDSRLVAYPVRSGSWLRSSEGNDLVVNTRLVDDDSTLAIGRAVTLVIGGRPTQWRVSGVVESGPSPAAYVGTGAFRRVVGDSLVRTVVVRASVRSTASQSELVRLMRAELDRRGFDVANTQLMDANRQVIEDHLLMVAGFLLVMAQLTIVVGGLGLASTMSLAVLERTREIGIMRAIGARHRSILAIVLIEGLVIGVLSWVIAIPMSLPMSVLLGRAFGRIMMPVPVAWMPEPSGVLLWLGVVVIVSVVASAWPAFRAMRITTAAALAYE